MNDVTNMPFDQYQRYRLVADILEQVRAGKRPMRVLDVGGRTALLRRFLPDDDITLVDVEESDEPGLVLGNGSSLPFQHAVFDAVVTFDTLEHVPPAGRDAFIRECRRVTNDWVIIAGPYDTPRVAEAEEHLREFLGEKLELEHRYLNEHHEHGLPSKDDTVSTLIELGGQVSSIGHGNIDRWLLLMCLSLYMDRDAPLRGMAARFHKFYNEALYASDHATPVYRHAIVASFANEQPPVAEPILDPPVAPEGTLARFQGLAEELLKFDVQRDVWQKEWDRLTEVNAGHLENIAGHEKRTAELKQRMKEREEVIETLEVDLSGHAERVENLESELDETKKDYASSEAEHAKVERDLELDLAEHKSSIADLEQGLEDVKADARLQIDGHLASIATLEEEVRAQRAVGEELHASIEALQTHQVGLESELVRMNEVAESIQADLLAANASLESQQGVLVEREAFIEFLRAELRSRKKNLKRAFAWEKPQY